MNINDNTFSIRLDLQRASLHLKQFILAENDEIVKLIQQRIDEYCKPDNLNKVITNLVNEAIVPVLKSKIITHINNSIDKPLTAQLNNIDLENEFSSITQPILKLYGWNYHSGVYMKANMDNEIIITHDLANQKTKMIMPYGATYKLNVSTIQELNAIAKAFNLV